jgi:diguanylate cyclase (GGDEF)-like protein
MAEQKSSDARSAATEAQNLRSCLEVGKLLTSTHDLEEILELIVLKMSQLIRAENWSLLLKDGSTGELTFAAVAGVNKASLTGSVLPPGVGIAGHVAMTGEPLFVPDVSGDLRFHRDVDTATGFKTESIICVPLRIHAKTVGVIEIINADDVAAFRTDELPILSILADYAAIAIQNARYVTRIRKMSITDEYTGLYNARYLHKIVEEQINSSVKKGTKFGVVFADVDDFKTVVDKYGHLLGGQVLREIGQTMTCCLETSDILVKYGGDEYVLVLPGHDKTSAKALVERIRRSIVDSKYLTSEPKPVKITVSFGISIYPDNARTKKDLLLAADNSMYSVKRTTKDGVCVA